jgi:hypothetical protein
MYDHSPKRSQNGLENGMRIRLPHPLKAMQALEDESGIILVEVSTQSDWIACSNLSPQPPSSLTIWVYESPLPTRR